MKISNHRSASTNILRYKINYDDFDVNSIEKKKTNFQNSHFDPGAYNGYGRKYVCQLETAQTW